MDEIKITPYRQLGSAVRDRLIRLFGGDDDLASAFWEEVEIVVTSAKHYGFTLQSTRKKVSNQRQGKQLDLHMKDVAKASRALRVLLDADTVNHLASPPANQLAMPDARKNVDRVRTIKGMLMELESEIKTGQWEEVKRFEMTRLDYFLARSVKSTLLFSERGKPFLSEYRRLLLLVFRDLGIRTSVDEAIKGAARHE